MSVKRYDTGRGQDYECSSGRYVLHSDYAALLARHNSLREAVRRLTKADDDLLTMWDAMADNKQLEDEYHAARAAVDSLVGE